MYRHSMICLLIGLLLSACTLPLSTTQQATDENAESPVVSVETTNLQATVVLLAPTQAVTLIPASPTLTVTIEITPTQAAAPEVITEPQAQFMVQTGTPVETANFLHPEAGCNWLGVGGQVFGKDEKPVTGLVVEVGGTLADSPVLFLTLTGGNTILGPGGYEITISDQLIASEGSLWVQLYDLNGIPQSEQIYFDTYAENDNCEKNLIIVNFNEIGFAENEYYFPFILNAGKISE